MSHMIETLETRALMSGSLLGSFASGLTHLAFDMVQFTTDRAAFAAVRVADRAAIVAARKADNALLVADRLAMRTDRHDADKLAADKAQFAADLQKRTDDAVALINAMKNDITHWLSVLVADRTGVPLP